MTTAVQRVTYREVLAVREFRAIFAAEFLSVTGDQVARIAVALLVYRQSGSSLAASATYACSYLTWLLGGPFLSTIGDRYPRRTVMLVCDGLRGGLVLLLTLPDVSLAPVFAVLLLVGLLSPPFEAARSALLPDVLAPEAYVVGNALQNSVFTVGQVFGFAGGGALVGALSVRGALFVDAATFVLSGLCVLLFVRARPSARTATSRGSILADTREGLEVVRRIPSLTWLLAIASLSMATTIPMEGLAVPVAAAVGGGAVAAGLLSAAVPAGYVVGAFLLTRLPSERRLRLLSPMLVLTAAPLVLSPFLNGPTTLVFVWGVAGVGSALQIVANAAYVLATPPEYRARAFGLAATLLMGTQGGVLLLVGALAEVTDPRRVIAGVGLVCLGLVPVVARISPDEVRSPQGRHRRRRIPS